MAMALAHRQICAQIPHSKGAKLGQNVFDHVLAAHQVDALKPLIWQVAGVARLPKGNQESLSPQQFLQSRCHLQRGKNQLKEIRVRKK